MDLRDASWWHCRYQSSMSWNLRFSTLGRAQECPRNDSGGDDDGLFSLIVVAVQRLSISFVSSMSMLPPQPLVNFEEPSSIPT